MLLKALFLSSLTNLIRSVNLSVISYSLGATSEVTGSKHFLEIDGHTFLIDCGAWQGNKEIADEKNRSFNIAADKIDAIFLTHSHFDHCGLLPKLVKDGYNKKIYSTAATADLANIVMLDSAKIQAKDSIKKEPIYTEKDCVQTSNLFKTIPYNHKISINKNMEMELFDAGHILGSSMVSLTIKNQRKSLFQKLKKQESKDINILYSGDLGRQNTPIIRDPYIHMNAPDYLFLESTYGNRLHETAKEVYDDLTQIINDTVAKKGKVIIPSFAIERTQELLYYIRKLMDEKKIPKIPIYVDSPMASNATGVFQMHPECYSPKFKKELSQHKNPFSIGTLQFVGDYLDSKNLMKSKDPLIVIAANGMCEAGRIIGHLQEGIEDPNNTILIVGFMGEGTLGRKILEGEKEVKIGDDWYKVKAQIKKINALSSHADKKEIISWLIKIDTSKLKTIFLVHGELTAQEELKHQIERKFGIPVKIVKNNKKYYLK